MVRFGVKRGSDVGIVELLGLGWRRIGICQKPELFRFKVQEDGWTDGRTFRVSEDK
jgi:hypothetical protein